MLETDEGRQKKERHIYKCVVAVVRRVFVIHVQYRKLPMNVNLTQRISDSLEHHSYDCVQCMHSARFVLYLTRYCNGYDGTEMITHILYHWVCFDCIESTINEFSAVSSILSYRTHKYAANANATNAVKWKIRHLL